MKRMNKREAAAIAEAELDALRALGYEALAERAEKNRHFQVTGQSGKPYDVETMIYWDGRAHTGVRVIAAVSTGGGWSFFHPLSRDFIIDPNGSFVGE